MHALPHIQALGIEKGIVSDERVAEVAVSKYRDILICFGVTVFGNKKGLPSGNPFSVYGSPNWTRTSDPMINSHLLYQLSYRGIKLCAYLTDHVLSGQYFI